MGYIYKITNQINNKIYIGQTIKSRPTDRFSQHRYLARHIEQEKTISYLHRAMAEYGVDNFSFEIIEKVENELLNQQEQYWISFYNSLVPNGYNLTLGGDGAPGFSRPQSAQEREKKGQSVKRFYEEHPEKRKERSEQAKSYWSSEERRKEQSKRSKQFFQEHPDYFKGENNPMYGKHHTEEALEKIRAHAATRKFPIAQLDKDTRKVIQIFDGVKDAEKALGVSHGWLSKAAKVHKIAYGYRWKFI